MNYNREQDITPFENTKFNLPEEEINFFPSDDKSVWVFERTENYSLNPNSMVYEIDNMPEGADHNYVEGYLSQLYPNAQINAYEDEKTWLLDKEHGCYL